jgi:hypothetical protein
MNDHDVPAVVLKRAVESQHGGTATFVGWVPIKGETVWGSVVAVFDLAGHPTAIRAYAWFDEDRAGKQRFFAVLHAPPITGPLEALRSSLASEQGNSHWPGGWFDPTEKECLGLERELQKELGSKHELKDRSARLIARRRDSDEALYELEGGQVAQAHLTWRKSSEPDPRWPVCSVFESRDEWRQFWVSEIEPGLVKD